MGSAVWPRAVWRRSAGTGLGRDRHAGLDASSRWRRRCNRRPRTGARGTQRWRESRRSRRWGHLSWRRHPWGRYPGRRGLRGCLCRCCWCSGMRRAHLGARPAGRRHCAGVARIGHRTTSLRSGGHRFGPAETTTLPADPRERMRSRAEASCGEPQAPPDSDVRSGNCWVSEASLGRLSATTRWSPSSGA
jgi:hypothetical protein